MYTNEDLKELVDRRGLGYTVEHLTDTENIIDPSIRVLFEQVQRTLDEIQEKLEFAGV